MTTKELLTIEPIGFVESVYTEKFGTPRQANIVTLALGRVRLLPPYDDEAAFTGIELSSHLWIQFLFHLNRDNKWRPRVRPPRVGGNQTVGVFATRSPYRPNRLGLSVVEYAGLLREGRSLFLQFRGGDMVHGTPVVDIKPYVPYADSIALATNDLAHSAPPTYPVIFADGVRCEDVFKRLIEDVLGQDPRPPYHSVHSQREYKTSLNGRLIVWAMEASQEGDKQIKVISVGPAESSP